MKYKAIYEALEQRRKNTPSFRYSDYSGWRAANQSYLTLQRPLWVVAEDPVAGRRLWITQDGSQLSITIGPMDEKGQNYGSANMTRYENRTQMALALRKLFAPETSAA